MSKTKLKNIAVVSSLLAVFIIASLMAFFGSTDLVTNSFTAGNVKIELLEDKYNDVAYKTLASSQLMDKDPCVKNTGKNDAIVFLEVELPMQEATLLNDVGKKIDSEPKNHILYNFISSAHDKQNMQNNKLVDNIQFSYDSDWILISTYPVTKTNNGKSTVYYLFAYDKRLKNGDKTDTLFDQIQLRNILEQQELQKSSIVLNAYAVQADYVNEQIGKDTQEVTDEEVLKTIFINYFESAYKAG